jgi:hypothetical protein
VRSLPDRDARALLMYCAMMVGRDIDEAMLGEIATLVQQVRTTAYNGKRGVTMEEFYKAIHDIQHRPGVYLGRLAEISAFYRRYRALADPLDGLKKENEDEEQEDEETR